MILIFRRSAIAFTFLNFFLQLILGYFFHRPLGFVFMSSILPSFNCTIPLETKRNWLRTMIFFYYDMNYQMLLTKYGQYLQSRMCIKNARAFRISFQLYIIILVHYCMRLLILNEKWCFKKQIPRAILKAIPVLGPSYISNFRFVECILNNRWWDSLSNYLLFELHSTRRKFDV